LQIEPEGQGKGDIQDFRNRTTPMVRIAEVAKMSTEQPTRPRLLRIPLPGGSGLAPTGAVQFQDDWPGLFMRGDQAILVSVCIREMEKALARHDDAAAARWLAKLLPLAELIERDVKVQ
jgi:hypothetical protein